MLISNKILIAISLKLVCIGYFLFQSLASVLEQDLETPSFLPINMYNINDDVPHPIERNADAS